MCLRACVPVCTALLQQALSAAQERERERERPVMAEAGQAKVSISKRVADGVNDDSEYVWRNSITTFHFSDRVIITSSVMHTTRMLHVVFISLVSLIFFFSPTDIGWGRTGDRVSVCWCECGHRT